MPGFRTGRSTGKSAPMQNAGSRTRYADLTLRGVSRTLSAATQSPRLQKTVLFLAVALVATAIFAAQHAGAATLSGRAHHSHAHRAASAQTSMSPYDLMQRWEPVIAEAAEKFAVPADWIRAVMTRESGGRTQAVSRCGAVGLMQLMPATYDEMRRQFRLGANRFDPHDNILAGAAYLRFLNEKYGVSGMFAAYNAGPGAYERSLGGGSLPAETRQYVQRVSAQLGISTASSSATAADGQRVNSTFAPVPVVNASTAPAVNPTTTAPVVTASTSPVAPPAPPPVQTAANS